MTMNKEILLIVISIISLTGFKEKNFLNRNIVSIKHAASVYEVRFTYTGYTTFAGTAADCNIRPNGKVTLTGMLTGIENVSAEDDIMYTGTLQINIDMDICSAKATADANGEYKICGMTVKGTGPVKTEFEVYSDGQNAARGAYVKIKYDATLGRFQRSVTGNCDPQQMVEEETMVPNKTIASIFNGLELPEFNYRTLRAGLYYVETNPAGKLEVQVVRKVS